MERKNKSSTKKHNVCRCIFQIKSSDSRRGAFAFYLLLQVGINLNVSTIKSTKNKTDRDDITTR